LNRWTWASLTFVLTGLVSGCEAASSPGVSSPVPTHPASPPPPARSGSAPPTGTDTGGGLDPEWVTRPALTCGDNKRLFPPEALKGPGLAELGLDPASAVLRTTIGDTPNYLSDQGWHRVLQSPDGVTFVAPGNAETPWFEVTVGLFDGDLQPIIQGQCTLAIAAPAGVTFARWWLDPDAPPPTAESTQLAVLLREQACASGKPPTGRVLEPTVVTRADAIEVAIGIRKQGNADCPGNPAHPMRLVLPEPIGARRLFDASVFPPRVVTTEDPG
jgi:hypothetical protein